MEHEIKNLKEFIHEKFESHEELEALRFKRIDEEPNRQIQNAGDHPSPVCGPWLRKRN